MTAFENKCMLARGKRIPSEERGENICDRCIREKGIREDANKYGEALLASFFFKYELVIVRSPKRKRIQEEKNIDERGLV